MFGRIILIGTIVVAIGAAGVWGTKLFSSGQDGADNEAVAAKADEAPQPANIGEDLYHQAPPKLPAPAVDKAQAALNPIVIEGTLNVINKQEVPSIRDGRIEVIGTELKPGEEKTLPPDRIVEGYWRGKLMKFKKLREEDRVVTGQLLAIVDDRVDLAEYRNKLAKVAVSYAEQEAAKATADEAEQQMHISEKLNRNKQVEADEKYRTAKLAFVKYRKEFESKSAQINQAKEELNQADTLLSLHEIRSSIDGVVKAIHKHGGEAVKSSPGYEPLIQIVDLKKLRVEGLADEHYINRLRNGMEVVIERAQPEMPVKTCRGHLQEVTSVAVAVNGPRKRVVSASLDGTVRVWDRITFGETHIYWHPNNTAVRAVACSPKGAKENLCLSGAADGVARLWDLNSESTQPIRTLDGKHQRPIQCAAFSPGGDYCAVAGEDREIFIHDTATGALKYKLTGHSGAVTSLMFAPESKLVSAGSDKTIRVWKLGTQAGKLETKIEGRSGDVTQVGVSPDGKNVFFDQKQGKSLRILSLPDRRLQGVVQGTSNAAQFSVMSLFSPDGQLILTASAREGRLQLWRSPLNFGRASVARQLTTEEHSEPTCGAFDPDGDFVATGARDKNVYVWKMPDKAEIERQLKATITRVESTLDSSSHQVRVWAELDNPGDLMPGANVTMVRFQE